MPELTEEEARAAAASQLLLKQIASNPKARELLQQAYKTVRPDAVIPEVDQRTELNQQLTEIRDTVNSFVKTQTDAAAEAKAEAEKAQVERRMNEGFERLREQKVTPEGIEAVKKIMADEGILNPEIAWNHFEKLPPPAEIVLPTGSSGWNFAQVADDTNADIKKLIESRGENNQVLDKMAREALNEVRGASPRR